MVRTEFITAEDYENAFFYCFLRNFLNNMKKGCFTQFIDLDAGLGKAESCFPGISYAKVSDFSNVFEPSHASR